MKTIRADVLDNYVVVYGADDAGEPKTFVIADDSSAYAVLRDAISSASEASPRASVGGAARRRTGRLLDFGRGRFFRGRARYHRNGRTGRRIVGRVYGGPA